MGYEVLDHTADVRVRVYGETFEDFLKSAALALMDLITDRANVKPLKDIGFEVEAETGEELLIKMLGEILYINQVRDMVFHEVELQIIGEHKVKGKLKGEQFDPERHDLELDIKAATYHNLKIQRVNDRFIAEIVFDI